MLNGQVVGPVPAGYVLIPGVLHAYKASATDLSGYVSRDRIVPPTRTMTTANAIATTTATMGITAPTDAEGGLRRVRLPPSTRACAGVHPA